MDKAYLMFNIIKYSHIHSTLNIEEFDGYYLILSNNGVDLTAPLKNNGDSKIFTSIYDFAYININKYLRDERKKAVTDNLSFKTFVNNTIISIYKIGKTLGKEIAGFYNIDDIKNEV